MLLLQVLLACAGSEDVEDTNPPEVEDSGLFEEEEEEETRVGFEILQVVSQDEIIVWINVGDLTLEDFDALELESGWFKNEPREGVPDASSFDRSPGETESGVFTFEEHYGIEWMHNATVTEASLSFDEGGLLSGALVHKHHTVEYDEGRSVPAIVSPEGEHYILVSRDAERTQEDPSIPPTWQSIMVETTSRHSLPLPEYTVNIRTDNEDSFQGPLTTGELGL